jgi:uncharacterized membrane protein YfcA
MDFWNYAIIFAALAAGAVVKGATGMGLPLVALPALTAAFGLTHAIGLMVVPVLVSNLWQVVRLRASRKASGLAFMPLFLAGVAVGVVAGTWLLKTLPERWLVVALGLMLVIYVGIRLARPATRVSAELARRVGLPVGAAAGVLNGATGISAPIGVTFIHWMGLDRDAHIFAVSAMFLAMGATQLPAMFAAGLMEPFWLVEGVFALVPIVLFMPVGRVLALRMSREAFDRLVLVVLGLIGVKMLVGL